jgi:hypothetical protein
LSLHVTTRDAATKLWIGIIEKEISEQVVWQKMIHDVTEKAAFIMSVSLGHKK